MDNDSSDGSAEMVETNYPDVQLIRSGSNLGFAKANNIGIKRSSGEFICLINSDVEVLPGCFDSLISFMQSHPEVAGVGPRILNADLSTQVSCRKFPSLWNNFCRAFALDRRFEKVPLFSGEQMFYFSHSETKRVQVLSGCFMMLRRSTIEDVGLLDERFFIYAEDIDWCRRFSDAGKILMFFPHAQAIHYGGGSSANAPVRFSIEQIKARFQYWGKYHGKAAIIGFAFIVALHHLVRIFGGIALYMITTNRRTRLRDKIIANWKTVKAVCPLTSKMIKNDRNPNERS